MDLKDIVWNHFCDKTGRTMCENTREIHYDLMDLLIKKHNIKQHTTISFENAFLLYNYIGEFQMLLNQVGAYYEPSIKKKNKLKEIYDNYINITN